MVHLLRAPTKQEQASGRRNKEEIYQETLLATARRRRDLPGGLADNGKTKIHGGGKDLARLAAALISSLGLIGARCGAAPRPYHPPSARGIVMKLIDRGSRPEALRGDFRVSIQVEDKRTNLSFWYLALGPGKLRFDIISPLEAALPVLVSSEGKVSFLDYENKLHIWGNADHCAFTRLTGVALSPANLFALLAGGIPLIKFEEVSVFWNEMKKRELLTLRDRKGRVQEIELVLIGARPLVITSRIADAAGRNIFEFRASRFRKLGALVQPQRIWISDLLRNSELDLRFSRQERGIDISEAAFDHLSPENMSSEHFSCHEEPLFFP